MLAEGTVPAILDRFPHGFESQVLDISYIYRVEEKSGGAWTPVFDQTVWESMGVPLPPRITVTAPREAKSFGQLMAVPA